MKTKIAKNIDEYITAQPGNAAKLLQGLRQTISKAAPDAQEVISYGMPAFKYHGMLVYFAGWKEHIGFYPVSSGIKAFKKDLLPYKVSKGTIQFPLDKPLPLKLISKIVKFRVKENDEKAKAKSLRVCPKGHKYYKSSDCPTCPVCEKLHKPKGGLLSVIAAPARRALQNKGITNAQQLSKFSEAEIFALHGMGKGSLPKMRMALKAEGLTFKKK